MQNPTSKKSKVFFFEDYSAKELNENRLGRKGLSLFKLKDMDVPVPEFFVVSSDVFVDFAFNSLEEGRKKLAAISKKIHTGRKLSDEQKRKISEGMKRAKRKKAEMGN